MNTKPKKPGYFKRRAIIKVCRKLISEFGERNLRRPWSFEVPAKRREWYERNADRLERMLHGQPLFARSSS